MNLTVFIALRRRIREFFYFSKIAKRRRASRRTHPRTYLECDAHDLGYFVWHHLLPIVGVFTYPLDELMLMGATMIDLKPSLVIEWGTHIGTSARIFHELNKYYEIGSEIHSIDLPDDIDHAQHPHKWRGVLVRGLPVILHQGDGVTIATELITEKNCAEPLVFIDGDHEQKMVKREIDMVLSAAPNATLLVHDTFYQPGSDYNHGPYLAVKEAISEIGEEKQVIHVGFGRPGMTLVRPIRK